MILFIAPLRSGEQSSSLYDNVGDLLGCFKMKLLFHITVCQAVTHRSLVSLFLKLWSRSLNASPEPHRFVSPAKLTRAALPPPAGHFQPYAEQLFKADTGSDEISSVLWCVLSVLDFFKAFYRPENIISVRKNESRLPAVRNNC